MIRERALKIVLVLVGLLFVSFAYPVVMFLWHPNQEEVTMPMMLSIYVTLGVFLLLASRNPSANRSLIAFTAWSSFAHAAIMAVQSLHNVSERGHLLAGVLLFVIVGVVDRARASKAKSGWGMIAARLPQPAVFEGWGNPDGVRYLQHCRTRVSDPHGQCSSPQLRDHSLQ